MFLLVALIRDAVQATIPPKNRTLPLVSSSN
jgi:hypothetical protein